MGITKIKGNDCKKGRSLWEEVFSEDSKEFTEYYFEQKAKNNIGYVLGKEPYEAMLYRTPYPIQIYREQKSLSYIVGVATRESVRHQGKMTALMKKALEDMYREKNPFTFLMPANPAIYEPFDFRYVYERPVWEFKDETFPLLVLEPLIGTKKIVKIELPQEKTREHTGKELKAAWTEAFHWSGIKNQVAEDNVQIEKQQRLLTIKSVSGSIEENTEINIYQKLADFANQWLAVHADIYVYRDASYYEMQIKESQAQNGDIFLMEEHGEIVGFFLYAREGDEIFVQEVMEQEEGLFSFLQIQPQKKPIIMARIVHLEEMLKLVRSSEHKTILLEVKDKLIQENTGLYLWEITPTGSLVSCIEKQSEDISLSGNDTTKDENISIDIGELTPYLFGRVFINEIV